MNDEKRTEGIRTTSSDVRETSDSHTAAVSHLVSLRQTSDQMCELTHLICVCVPYSRNTFTYHMCQLTHIVHTSWHVSFVSPDYMNDETRTEGIRTTSPDVRETSDYRTAAVSRFVSLPQTSEQMCEPTHLICECVPCSRNTFTYHMCQLAHIVHRD